MMLDFELKNDFEIVSNKSIRFLFRFLAPLVRGRSRSERGIGSRSPGPKIREPNLGIHAQRAHAKRGLVNKSIRSLFRFLAPLVRGRSRSERGIGSRRPGPKIRNANLGIHALRA
jgi:hypothetical protein